MLDQCIKILKRLSCQLSYSLNGLLLHLKVLRRKWGNLLQYETHVSPFNPLIVPPYGLTSSSLYSVTVTYTLLLSFKLNSFGVAPDEVMGILKINTQERTDSSRRDLQVRLGSSFSLDKL